MEKLRALSLFSGAMGLDLGLEAAGIEVVGCVEYNAQAVETIRANRPGLPVVQGDISKMSASEMLLRLKEAGLKDAGEINLLVGGPPCQAFSLFGKRRGTGDPRGRLVFDFARLVKSLAPGAFVMENVRGLESMRLTPEDAPGSLLKELLKDFNEAGYRVDGFCVNSANYGAPQVRERLILIGNRLGMRAEFPQPTHSDKPTGDQRPFATLGGAIRGVPDPDPSLMDFSERKRKYFAMVPPGGNWRSLPLDVQKESMGKTFYLKGGRSAYWRRLSYDFPCPTVMTLPNHSGTGMCHPEETRPLTAGECSLVQGFPSDWKFCGSVAEKYKQIGNAVPVMLGKVAGETVARMFGAESACVVGTAPLENTMTHIRPQVRTRQYWKGGKTMSGTSAYGVVESALDDPRALFPGSFMTNEQMSAYVKSMNDPTNDYEGC